MRCSGLTTDPTVFLLLVFALSMVLGTALDAIAVLTLTVPILLPIGAPYDVDPIALGVLMIVSQMIGLLTPPVGTVIFVLQAIAKATMSEVFWGSVPFMVPLMLLCLGDHLLARRDPVPAREAGAVTAPATPRSWLAGLLGQGVGPSLTPGAARAGGAAAGPALRLQGRRARRPDALDSGATSSGCSAGAIELGFDGLNVTHPVKQAMVPLVDERRLRGRGDRSAQHGADPRRPYDGPQHRRDRLSPGLPSSGCPTSTATRVLLLGAGGAGTAVAHALVAARRAAVARRRPGPASGRRRSGVRLGALPIKVELATVVPVRTRPTRWRRARESSTPAPIGMAGPPGLAGPGRSAPTGPVGGRHRLPPARHRRS